MTSIRVAGRELLHDGLDVGTDDVTDVVVTLSGRTWRLAGVIRDQAGRPVPGGRVIVFPRAEAERHVGGYYRAPRLHHLTADRLGAFQVTGAFGGDYFAAAVATPPDHWMAPEYLETLVPRATTIKLELDAKQTIELRLK